MEHRNRNPFKNRVNPGLRYYHYPVIILAALLSWAWGFWAHEQINALAILPLPPEMRVFYKSHADYLAAHAVDADRRRYAVPGEAPHHYIDLDHYGSYPYPALPRKWKEAELRFGKDSLEAHGTVPWHVVLIHRRLTQAFIDKDGGAILRYSADLGHYIADAHVPLHTTSNYNGQKTGQRGIHALWESRLPELFGGSYPFFTGKAGYVDDPAGMIWTAVLESNLAVDSVLQLEKKATLLAGESRKYTFEERGGVLTRVYSKEFCRHYHRLMAGMVASRMRQSAKCVADFWFTAWVDAGQPDLGKIKPVRGRKGAAGKEAREMEECR